MQEGAGCGQRCGEPAGSARAVAQSRAQGEERRRVTDGSQVPALSAVAGGDPCLGAGTTPASCAPSGRLGPLLRHGEVPLLPGGGRLPDMRTVPRGPFLHAASSPGAQRVPRGRLAFSLPRAVASLTQPEAFHRRGVQGGQSLRMRRFSGVTWKPSNRWAASRGAISAPALGGAGQPRGFSAGGSPSSCLSAFGIRGDFGTQAGIGGVRGG